MTARIAKERELVEARAEAARWRKACDDESLAKSNACQRVSELERELLETQARLTGLQATLQRAKELRLTCTPAERAVLSLVAEARAAWAARDPHDDFRFGIPSLMGLGRDIESELARRGEKP